MIFCWTRISDRGKSWGGLMQIQQVGSASVVSLPERVDSVTSPEVQAALEPVIAANPCQLICECAATKYISSAGLRVLLLAAKNLKRAGGHFGLVCSKTNYVYEIFELAGITHVIPVFETVDEAMARLA